MQQDTDVKRHILPTPRAPSLSCGARSQIKLQSHVAAEN